MPQILRLSGSGHITTYYLSQNGPKTKRITIVELTAAMLDVQICSVVKFKLVCTSARRGLIANHMRNATW